ncbi:MAG: bifunctional phosphoglucose/phosphomannose isomerase [Candidatus Omnitrophica bacterium]|nr:bifunctional phosphoglucose/phosphomannose isomerase [Candidatus Omnitrophota bacterium]
MKIDKIKIKKFDKSNMLMLLKNFSKHCSDGYNLDVPKINKEFDKIIFTGMGGSGIAGDLIKVILEEFTEIPVFVIKDYNLPKFVNSKSLVFIESYSGNTEETISIYKSAKDKKSIILCISSNGEIEKMANRDEIPLIKIPSGMPPRSALGYLFFPVYKFFVENKILQNLEENFFKKIENWVEDFSLEKTNNKAIELAERFYKKIPIIYSENRFYPGILRWKTQFAENSKQFSFINILPEMNHNEIMSFTYPNWFIKKIEVLFIISKMENKRIERRIEITSNIISEKIEKEILKLELEGDNIIEKLIYLIILGDWISYYLAILNKVDPTEIKEINILKEELQKGGVL